MALSLGLGRGAQPPVSTNQAPSLPELPQLALESLLPSVRGVVQTAYDAVIAHPDDAAANGKLGMILHANNALAESEICYRRAHLLDRTSFRWAYFLGLVLANRGNYDESPAALREALRLDPDYLPAQLKLGELLLASGQWQEAAHVYQTILGKHPDSAQAHYGLGRVRAARKDLAGAVESLRRACELFPNFGPAHYALAHTYKRLGDTVQSLGQLALYSKYRTSAPEAGDRVQDEIRTLSASARDQMRLGMELVREGKLEAAVAAHEKALEIDPQLVAAHVSLISLYAQLGKFPAGEEHYLQAVRLDPKDPRSYFGHGLLLADRGRFPEAEAAFRKALEINPDYPGARLNLGHMLEAQHKLPDAEAQYRRAAETDPVDSQAHFDLGRLLVNQENYQEGIRHFLKSLSTGGEESKPSCLYALGAAYARSGDRKSGLVYLRQAREEAAARGQSKLVESIDEDLRALETEGSPVKP